MVRIGREERREAALADLDMGIVMGVRSGDVNAWPSNANARMYSHWLRKGVRRPDVADLGRMGRRAPEPRQKVRSMVSRALARRTAALELAVEPFATRHDR